MVGHGGRAGPRGPVRASEATRAAIASPAADLERDDHPVAPTETAHGVAGLDDLRDELVAERERPGERHPTVDDGVVHVARRDDQRADERIVGRLDARVGASSHRTVPGSMNDSCRMAPPPIGDRGSRRELSQPHVL